MMEKKGKIYKTLKYGGPLLSFKITTMKPNVSLKLNLKLNFEFKAKF